MALPARCPQCGTDARSEAGIEGLCPQCLFSLALLESPSPVYSADAPTQYGASTGRLLGDRYQIRELLGRGGMGEVYRAFDLKLRVDVALKTVRPGQAWDERARDLLRQEVRAAREVVSPNVCRIFDLGGPGRPGAAVDGVHRRRYAGRDAPHARAAPALRRAGDRVAVPRRARGDPRRGARAPRFQAGEHHGHARRARRGHGFRRRARRARRPEPHDCGHAGVHGARAGPR